ncbi:exported hypothetical protein [Syntrophobacter sp. SbD1]|nr:exported hypothetical protein [Syntrophobacter sp. SbD1]
MRKTLIFAIAFSFVLVSGSLFSAQADCGLNPRSWHFASCGTCGSQPVSHDIDKGKPLAYRPLSDSALIDNRN